MFVGVFSSQVLREVRPPGSLLIVVVLMLECCDRSFRAASGCLQTARPQNSRFSKCKIAFIKARRPGVASEFHKRQEKNTVFLASLPQSHSPFST